MTTLFKIITLKDEIVIGLNADELDRLGGRDAGTVARALAAKGEMTVWQYGVRRGPNGELQQAPTQKIGLLANSSLRVEPGNRVIACAGDGKTGAGLATLGRCRSFPGGEHTLTGTIVSGGSGRSNSRRISCASSSLAPDSLGTTDTLTGFI